MREHLDPLTLHIMWGISNGEWLQASAGFLGVIATILATLGIETWRRRRVDQQKVKRLQDALSIFRNSIEAVRNEIGENHSQEAAIDSLLLQSGLISAIDRYDFVRNSTEITEPMLWETLRRLDASIERNRSALKAESETLRAHLHSQGVYDVNRDRVRMSGHDLAMWCKPALEAVSDLKTP